MTNKHRLAHYNKNAVQMHASRCADPERCLYGLPKKDPRVVAARLKQQEALAYHRNTCMTDEGAAGLVKCQCSGLIASVDCMAAVYAENASAEIERHLAAIRKIKKKGRPLKGREAYEVYPK